MRGTGVVAGASARVAIPRSVKPTTPGARQGNVAVRASADHAAGQSNVVPGPHPAGAAAISARWVVPHVPMILSRAASPFHHPPCPFNPLSLFPCRRLELQKQAQQLLQADDSWHTAGPLPPNVTAVTSPRHLKSLLLNAPADSLIVVDFFAPHCNGCRTLWPKIKQIAGNNPDVLFLTVNTAEPGLQDLGLNLGVAKLPWFQLYSGGPDFQLVSSFTATLAKVDMIRAEISAYKACPDPMCSMST